MKGSYERVKFGNIFPAWHSAFKLGRKRRSQSVVAGVIIDMSLDSSSTQAAPPGWISGQLPIVWSSLLR
jgi:hypothetical protein